MVKILLSLVLLLFLRSDSDFIKGIFILSDELELLEWL